MRQTLKQTFGTNYSNITELIEIKSGRMYHDRFARHLRSVGTLLNVPETNRTVAMRIDTPYIDHGINVCPIRNLLRGESPVA